MAVAEWKSPSGYEGLYLVSSEGDVKSLMREIKSKGNGKRVIPERTLKKYVLGNGYEQVVLCKHGVTEKFLVHRLVASLFADGSGDQVNHKNGVKTDNSASNLEWCSSKENIKHSIDSGLRPARPKTSKAVMRSDGVLFPSINAAANEIKASRGSVYQQLHGKRNHVHGYTFTFAGEE